jgi:putative ABC transport system permease protein
VITPPIELDLEKMLLAIAMMVIAVGLSFWQKLGLTASLAIATLRSIMQLVIVGYLLDAVFDLKQPVVILLVVLLMSAIASVEARHRIGNKVPFVLPLVWLSVVAGAGTILAYTTAVVVRPEVWYSPQYLIPLAGMILGNAMNGASIAAEKLIGSLSDRTREIETHLSLGATPQQAIATYESEAIKTAMIPSINGMMVVGLVTLPGMMTGQILGGVSPLLAVRYQLVILFAITTANLITTLLVTKTISRQFFTPAQQLKQL